MRTLSLNCIVLDQRILSVPPVGLNSMSIRRSILCSSQESVEGTVTFDIRNRPKKQVNIIVHS